MRTYTSDEVNEWLEDIYTDDSLDAYFARKDEERDPYPHYWTVPGCLWRHDGPGTKQCVHWWCGIKQPGSWGSESEHVEARRIPTEEGQRREAEIEAKQAPRNADGDSIEDMRKVQEREGPYSIEIRCGDGWEPRVEHGGYWIFTRPVTDYRIAAKHADKPEQGPVRIPVCPAREGEKHIYLEDGRLLSEGYDDHLFIRPEYEDGLASMMLRRPNPEQGKPALVPVALWFAREEQ